MIACDQFTGLKRQICQGRITLPNGKVKKLTKNEQDRFLAMFAGESVPPRQGRSLPPVDADAVLNSDAEFTPYDGPGTELKALLKSLGIDESPSCNCKHRAQEMDRYGVWWSRQNKALIVEMMVSKYAERLKEKQSRMLWIPQTIRDVTASIAAGLLFDEACNRYMRRLAGQRESIQFSVGVTTAPRKGPELLSRCVRSIYSAGFDDVTVYAEPDSALQTDCPVVRNPERLGAWRNWMATVKALLEKPADVLIVVQDDCVFSTGVREFLETALWPHYDCAALQLCCSAGYRKQPVGINPMPGVGMLGAWATVMHRYHAAQIIEYGEKYGWRGHHSRTENNPVLKKAIDDYIGHAVHAIGYRCYLVNPSIVLHDADFSSLNHGNSKGENNNRRTLAWIGEDARAIEHVPIRKGPVRFQT